MIYAVLLCDKNWKIERILHQTLHPDFFRAGSVFTDLVSDSDSLSQIDTEQYSLSLTFLEIDQTFPVMVRSFPECFLVVVARIRNDEELRFPTSRWNRQKRPLQKH